MLPGGQLRSSVTLALTAAAASVSSQAQRETLTLAGDFLDAFVTHAAEAGSPGERPTRLLHFLSARLGQAQPMAGESVESLVQRVMQSVVLPALSRSLEAAAAGAMTQLQSSLLASVPSRPASLEEARHALLGALGADPVLSFVVWLSALADMEASARLALEEAGADERTLAAEASRHDVSVRCEELHTLRRRAIFDGHVMSTRLAEIMFGHNGVAVAKGWYQCCEGMQLGVDGKATLINKPAAVTVSWMHKCDKFMRDGDPDPPPTMRAIAELHAYVLRAVQRSL